MVQLYGEYTRRGTLVFDPVESGAGSRLLDDVIFTSYKFFELGEVQVKCNNVECYNPQIDSTAVDLVRLYYRCSCTNRGTARVRLSLLQIPRARLYEFYPRFGILRLMDFEAGVIRVPQSY